MDLQRASEARADLQSYLDESFEGTGNLRVLDAGCGGVSRIRLPSDVEITGVDISPESAARNTAIKDIIIGDIQTCPLPAQNYDVILCWELLEHVAEPRRVLRSFIRALKDSGIIILAFPNVLSLKGLATKISPHTLHVWALRKFFNQKNAGRPGFAPFRTYLRWSLAPSAVTRYLEANGMEVAFMSAYEGNRILRLHQTSPLAHGVYRGLVRSLNLASLGRHDFGRSDVLMVVRRKNFIAANQNSTAKILAHANA